MAVAFASQVMGGAVVTYATDASDLTIEGTEEPVEEMEAPVEEVEEPAEEMEEPAEEMEEPVEGTEEPIEETSDQISEWDPNEPPPGYFEGDYSMIINDPNSSANEDTSQLLFYDDNIMYAPSMSRAINGIGNDRTARYTIQLENGQLIDCNRRSGKYFYTSSGGSYYVADIDEFVEKISIDFQIFQVTSATSIYTQPFAESKYDTGKDIAVGEYRITEQASNMFYVENGNASGWISSKPGTLKYAPSLLSGSSVAGVPYNVKLIPSKYTSTRPGNKMQPTYVTIHNTGNNGYGAGALAHSNLQYNGNSSGASWHFSVDDHVIYQSVPMNEKAYHAGDGRAQGNSNTIGIEICENSNSNYRKAEENAAKLTAAILHSQRLPYTAVKKHYDWSGKNCPQNMIEGTNGTMGWSGFMAMVKSEYAKLGPIETIEQDVSNADVFYKTHVQNQGWQYYAYDGMMSGTLGQSKRLEGIQIDLNDKYTQGDIQYMTHIQSIGWESGWKSNGETSGTEGKSLRLEAIRIQLTGELAKQYDIYYRVHAQSFGWLGWAKNGADAGTAGYSKRLEGIEIKLVKKGSAAPGSTDKPFVSKDEPEPDQVLPANVAYKTHVQTYGWQNYVRNGVMSGTEGKAKRLEGIQIKLESPPVSGGIEYRTHIQTLGWESSWKANNEMSGTEGRALRLEAIQIRLTGEMANKYDVYYRVHAQTYGWLGWAKNGAQAGTAGYAKRLEGIEIKVVPKGTAAPGSTNNSFISK